MGEKKFFLLEIDQTGIWLNQIEPNHVNKLAEFFDRNVIWGVIALISENFNYWAQL